jgi:hypothetical protein
MRTSIVVSLLCGSLWMIAPATPVEPGPSTTTTVAWRKVVVDAKFRSEGVAVADVNQDGKADIITGEIWYEAPAWKAHEMQKPGEYGDGLKNYSHTFAVWAEDFNKDGWPDALVIDFPGEPCYWLENPGKAGGHWKRHIVWHSACNETPIFTDLHGKGERVLVMGFQPKGNAKDSPFGQMAYFKPGADPRALWVMHPISEPSVLPEMKDGKIVKGTGNAIPGTHRYAHGLGVGDVNRDGRLDVLCTGGWWEQPVNAEGKPWLFHPAKLGEPCADMFVYDLDGDGKMDVLSTSAHKFGIWAYMQRATDSSGHPAFIKDELFKDLVSETHALHCEDIDGDGQKDLITGKRFYSHGRSEPGSDKAAMLYWFKANKDKSGLVKFTPIAIDDDSGIGTQFTIADVDGDGKRDIVTSNKKGVYVHFRK